MDYFQECLMTVVNPLHWSTVPEISCLLRKVIRNHPLQLAMYWRQFKLFLIVKTGIETNQMYLQFVTHIIY